MEGMRKGILLTLLAGMIVAQAGTKVACVGDSITFGATIKNRSKMSYPAQLQQELGDEYEVRNFGVNGATMQKATNRPYWKQRSYQKALAYAPDIVIIKLGSNDSKPENWVSADLYITDYLEMIESFRQLPSRPVVYICLPIPAFPSNFTITNKAITEEVIPAVKVVAERSETKLIDLNTPMLEMGHLVPDRVHPNGEGAGVIARVVAEFLRAESAE